MSREGRTSEIRQQQREDADADQERRKNDWISCASLHRLPSRGIYAFRARYSLSLPARFPSQASHLHCDSFLFILPLSNGSANGLLCIPMICCFD